LAAGSTVPGVRSFDLQFDPVTAKKFRELNGDLQIDDSLRCFAGNHPEVLNLAKKLLMADKLHLEAAVAKATLEQPPEPYSSFLERKIRHKADAVD